MKQGHETVKLLRITVGLKLIVTQTLYDPRKFLSQGHRFTLSSGNKLKVCIYLFSDTVQTKRGLITMVWII